MWSSVARRMRALGEADPQEILRELTREVLARLVGERLVSAINQKGYRVAPMSRYSARASLL